MWVKEKKGQTQAISGASSLTPEVSQASLYTWWPLPSPLWHSLSLLSPPFFVTLNLSPCPPLSSPFFQRGFAISTDSQNTGVQIAFDKFFLLSLVMRKLWFSWKLVAKSELRRDLKIPCDKIELYLDPVRSQKTVMDKKSLTLLCSGKWITTKNLLPTRLGSDFSCTFPLGSMKTLSHSLVDLWQVNHIFPLFFCTCWQGQTRTLQVFLFCFINDELISNSTFPWN